MGGLDWCLPSFRPASLRSNSGRGLPTPDVPKHTHTQFGLPCIFAVRLLKLGRAEAGLCCALAVLAVALSGAGLVSSAQQLAEALGGGGQR
jgi:hypothetical protein